MSMQTQPPDPGLSLQARPSANAVTKEAPPWVPISTLAPRHRSEVTAHLLGLSGPDRYLRFGYQASDDRIENYVNSIEFDRDEVFGIFNRRLDLIAVAHLACPERAGRQTAPTAAAPRIAASGTSGALQMAEFGGSVAEYARGRGYGARLFEHAMLHARNRGMTSLFIHALSENTVMLKIARHAGAVVQRSGSESDAYLTLPANTVASQVEQWVGEHAAALDYRLKHQVQMVDNLLGAMDEARSRLGKLAGSSPEPAETQEKSDKLI